MIGLGIGLTGNGRRAVAGTITIDTLTYTRGTAGVAPDLASTVSSTGTTTANFTLRGVLAATAQTESEINASGDKFEVTAATLAGLDGSLDLNNSATDGVISAYIFDSSDPVVKSAVVTETGVTYDAAAPVFASAEVGTIDATSLIVTFNKAIYGSTSAADWDVQVNGSPATESAAVISGSTVDITLGAAVANGDTVTVAYTGTGIVGVDAEVVATFTAQSVTNNVAAVSGVSVVQSQAYSDNGNTTSQSVTLPSGITDGNELLLIIGCNTGRTLTTPSGWALVGSARTTAAGITYIFQRTASSDSSASVALAFNIASVMAAIFYEVSCPNNGVEVAWADGVLDPPSNTPAGGSAEYAWIAGVKLERAFWTVTAAPSGYSGLLNSKSSTASSNTAEAEMATAHKISTASSEDPGGFSWSETPGGVDTAFTIAVR